MIPKCTEDAPPEVDDSGNPINWTAKPYEGLRRLIERIVPQLEAIKLGGAEESISVWFLPAEEGATSFPASLKELLSRYHSDGRFFVRIVNEDDVTYLSATVGPARSPVRGGDSITQIELAYGRTFEPLLLTNDKLRAEIDQCRDQVSDYHKRVIAAEDRAARAERDNESLRASLAQALEQAVPIFDEEQTLKLLNLFQLWIENPSGNKAMAKFVMLMRATVEFLSELHGDPVIMKRLASAHLPAWDKFQQAFNKLAEDSGQTPRLYSGTEVKTILRRKR